MANGEDSGTWGTITNTNWNVMEQAVTGVDTIVMANANYTLTNLNGVSDEARNIVIIATGTTGGAGKQIIAPLVPKFYIVYNNTSDGYAVNIGASTGSVITIPNGVTAQVYCDGSTGFYSAQTGSAGNFVVNGNLTVSGNSNIIPAGVIQMWPTASPPAGFLICNGASLSTSTYANLFAAIGYTFGGSSGNFLLPNYADRMPIGVGTIAASIGTTGGSKDATLVAHDHGGSVNTVDLNHTHYINFNTGGQSVGHTHNLSTNPANTGIYGQTTGGSLSPTAGFTGGYGVAIHNPYTEGTSNDHSHNVNGPTGYMSANNTHNHTISSAGSSATNANLPPYLGINFIIKT